MTQTVTVTGIVLSTMPIGDYDKRLTILTKERGKITAFAKGARKPNSALLACSQPFTFGEFQLYEGRTSYNVTAANVQNYFSELRNDWNMVYYGLYFCEFVDYVTREGNDDVEILKLLYQSLRALMNEKIGIVLVRYIFELKLIALFGEAPQVFECVKCGKQEDLSLFSVELGGMLCKECRRCAHDAVRLQNSTVYTMQFILATKVEKLYSFTVQDDVLMELKHRIDRYRQTYIDHKFKSLELIDNLN